MQNIDKIKLKVENLSTAFNIMGEYHRAVDNVSFDLYDGELLAVVGESGCGKSALALTLMGLHDDNVKVEGKITYNDQNIIELSKEKKRVMRGNELGMIFQEPLTALNPLVKVGKQIKEVFDIHRNYKENEAKEKVLKLIDDVGIPNAKIVYEKYPHELSGGMRQRVVIAMALACEPDIIIADEPTTALDVTIQAQILKLINELRLKKKTSTILITHDLGVVSEVADRVVVMYSGEIVEIAKVNDIFDNPMHPYTVSLLNSAPSNTNEKNKLYTIEGIVPSLQNIDRNGCRFASRIEKYKDIEHEDNPTLREIKEGHFVRCTCYKNFNIDNK